MALITTGLTNGGVTTHYNFSYDSSFGGTGGQEPARTNAVIAACENDYTALAGWFGGGINITGIAVQVTAQNGYGAGWGSLGGWKVTISDPQGASYRFNPAFIRYMLVMEVSEMFMSAQNAGWFVPGVNEGSKGEGLSRFLSGQFLAQNGFLALGMQSNFGVADLWLNSPRKDFVNNDPDDAGYDATNGCTTLFIYYLFHQLGFSINQIVAAGASTLAGVYKKLTGDTNDPFPFFKQLLTAAFPSQTSSAVPGPNFDDPWPLAVFSFVVTNGSFKKDQVNDSLMSASNGVFPTAFSLALDGFNRQVLGTISPTLSGPVTSLSGITMPPDPPGAVFANPLDMLVPQRALFSFDVDFTTAALAIFPAFGETPLEEALNGSIMILGKMFNTSTMLEFLTGGNPYFVNTDSAQNNVSWLSQDLRVFTATPSLNNLPVPGAPAFATDSFSGAYAYIQSLLGYLNATYSDPAGADPFDGASNVIPDQTGAYTGDSSVTPSTNSSANYNFAVARVRLRRDSEAVAGVAQNVKVFFRLWSTQTADTDFQPATYPSHEDSSGLPDWPLPATDSHSIPFFATDNAPNFTDPANPEYGTNGVNNRTITINSGDSLWTYFGCFLNVYDPSNIVNGSQIQALLNGTHHCLVAQIAFDDAPIINTNGVTQSPDNSDKLAQRNLQVTISDNPGSPATHVVSQTFDLRPSPVSILGKDLLLQYPDELVIDWGNIPAGTVASIYWPQVNAFYVLKLASEIYPSHWLSAGDDHTIQCLVTGGLTYVPIPTGSGQNFASLLSIALPPTVVTGQEFNVVIRRITTRRVQSRHPVKATSQGKPTSKKRAADLRAKNSVAEANWRYVVGVFQVKIPVSTADAMLSHEENTLAIFKWRLEAMSPTYRWYSVLQRYISIVSARVEGLGGDPKAILPSLSGAHLKKLDEHEKHDKLLPPHPADEKGSHDETPDDIVEHIGKVREIVYDRFGELEAFVLIDAHGSHVFKTRDREIGQVAISACRDGMTLAVYAGGHHQEIRKLAIRR